MMNVLTTLLAFVVALGVLVTVHEFGHYLVARLCGVKIKRFSVGFGKPLWMKRAGRDATEWVVAAIPLGGYVKMVDEREGEVAPADLPRAFNRQPVARRFAIVCAGPAANFVLAVAIFWLLLAYGVPALKPIIDAPPPGTPAAAAGLAAGDTILRVGSADVASWQDVRWHLLDDAFDRKSLDLTVRAATNGSITQRSLDVSMLSYADLDRDFMKPLGLALYTPPIAPVIGKVLPDTPAARSGLRDGDVITAIAGQPIDNWQQVVTAIRGHPSVALDLKVRRADRTLNLSVTPQPVAGNGASHIGRIGVAPHVDQGAFANLVTEVRYPLLPALAHAARKTWNMSVFTLKMLGEMVIGRVSLKNLSGPITIADYAGESAHVGWVAYLGFIALISISLGVLNLLPIPLLDGGHLMYYIVEIFRGRPVPDKVIEVGQQVGMVLLVTLMAFALYNDINRLISG
jgi:regulator of sigma E protease